MKTELDHVDFMRDSKLWPMPFLPVKNYKGVSPGRPPNVGVMLPNSPNVYMTDMFTMDIKNAEVKEYPNYYATVTDGWVVD